MTETCRNCGQLPKDHYDRGERGSVVCNARVTYYEPGPTFAEQLGRFHERLQTMLDERWGPFPTMWVGELLDELERRLAAVRIRNGQIDEWRIRVVRQRRELRRLNAGILRVSTWSQVRDQDAHRAYDELSRTLRKSEAIATERDEVRRDLASERRAHDQTRRERDTWKRRFERPHEIRYRCECGWIGRHGDASPYGTCPGCRVRAVEYEFPDPQPEPADTPEEAYERGVLPEPNPYALPPDIEAELARIESLTDEQILEEAKARGVDVHEQAARVKAMLLETARKTIDAKARLMADPKVYR